MITEDTIRTGMSPAEAVALATRLLAAAEKVQQAIKNGNPDAYMVVGKSQSPHGRALRVRIGAEP